MAFFEKDSARYMFIEIEKNKLNEPIKKKLREKFFNKEVVLTL
jgi:hypothetical protein